MNTTSQLDTPDKDVLEKNDQNTFSLVKRAQSFTHASRGIWIFFKTTQNAWIHIAVFVCVILLGLFLNISRIDWIVLFIVSGLVFVTESINTAIEIDIDLTSPTYHPYARDTKDVAAGAVLIASIVAIVVGILVFWSYVANFIR
jgi:diacylglycerol kinase